MKHATTDESQKNIILNTRKLMKEYILHEAILMESAKTHYCGKKIRAVVNRAEEGINW